MSEVKWIKIVTDIFDDEKVKYIETLPNGDTTIVIWFRLLCLAGKSNSQGFLMMTDRIAYTEEMLSSIFKRDIKVIQLALNIFENLGMVEVVDNAYYLTNWELHQNAEKLSKIKEQTRLRVAKHRENARIGNAISVTEALQSCYSNATDNISSSTSEESLSSSLKENNNKVKRFVKPSVDEIRDYINEQALSIDPNTFYDYYESNGWVVGKNKMKDWKATLRNWNRKEFEKKKETKGRSVADRIMSL